DEFVGVGPRRREQELHALAGGGAVEGDLHAPGVLDTQHRVEGGATQLDEVRALVRQLVLVVPGAGAGRQAVGRVGGGELVGFVQGLGAGLQDVQRERVGGVVEV